MRKYPPYFYLFIEDLNFFFKEKYRIGMVFDSLVAETKGAYYKEYYKDEEQQNKELLKKLKQKMDEKLYVAFKTILPEEEVLQEWIQTRPLKNTTFWN